MTLRVNEMYRSIQGEGPNVGIPTLFVRFVGCNFKCPGWPCDSQHAIDPKLYRTDMVTYNNIDDLVKDVYYKWYPGMNICFTGGEVMLQPIDDLERALNDIKDHTGGLCDIELFTNGSIKIPGNLRRMFNTVVLDWKLNDSGELYTGAQHENVLYNIQRLGNTDAVKFTVASRNDFDEAFERFKDMARWPMSRVPPIFVGVVWGKVAEADLVSWMLEAEVAWTLNVQLHKYIWSPEARRT